MLLEHGWPNYLLVIGYWLLVIGYCKYCWLLRRSAICARIICWPINCCWLSLTRWNFAAIWNSPVLLGSQRIILANSTNPALLGKKIRRSAMWLLTSTARELPKAIPPSLRLTCLMVLDGGRGLESAISCWLMMSIFRFRLCRYSPKARLVSLIW